MGTPIGSMDLLIAAHAFALGRTVVTNNTREFCRVAVEGGELGGGVINAAPVHRSSGRSPASGGSVLDDPNQQGPGRVYSISTIEPSAGIN